MRSRLALRLDSALESWKVFALRFRHAENLEIRTDLKECQVQRGAEDELTQTSVHRDTYYQLNCSAPINIVL